MGRVLVGKSSAMFNSRPRHVEQPSTWCLRAALSASLHAFADADGIVGCNAIKSRGPSSALQTLRTGLHRGVCRMHRRDNVGHYPSLVLYKVVSLTFPIGHSGRSTNELLQATHGLL
eukprot:212745-Chlamydomonas_euryale.AAC.6